jgi:hypothetical protein
VHQLYAAGIAAAKFPAAGNVTVTLWFHVVKGRFRKYPESPFFWHFFLGFVHFLLA